MRISDWSSDVCSSDLFRAFGDEDEFTGQRHAAVRLAPARQGFGAINLATRHIDDRLEERHELALPQTAAYLLGQCQMPAQAMGMRSEEHTSDPVTNAHLVCRLLLEKKKNKRKTQTN